MREVRSSAVVTAAAGEILELTAFSEDTEAGEPSAANRRQLGMKVTFPDGVTRTLSIDAAGAELIARIAVEAAVLIETQADVARRYLRHPESLSPHAVLELRRMAGEANE
ncbi:hypothetical protein [Arthrobacter sp. IK3]|uniref:hypothetical protein n=1 Tax=Arthrobacter sp. IK3 TaxID=3448169 RepID=UPI003EDF04F4